jgi:endogenous inhibitor of DNA gyrase (YacG/DUF329 family)
MWLLYVPGAVVNEQGKGGGVVEQPICGAQGGRMIDWNSPRFKRDSDKWIMRGPPEDAPLKCVLCGADYDDDDDPILTGFCSEECKRLDTLAVMMEAKRDAKREE